MKMLGNQFQNFLGLLEMHQEWVIREADVSFFGFDLGLPHLEAYWEAETKINVMTRLVFFNVQVIAFTGNEDDKKFVLEGELTLSSIQVCILFISVFVFVFLFFFSVCFIFAST